MESRKNELRSTQDKIVIQYEGKIAFTSYMYESVLYIV